LKLLTYFIDGCLLKYIIHDHGHVKFAVADEALILGAQVLDLYQMFHLRFHRGLLLNITRDSW